jgi:DNA-binding transcriptional MerR regulator
MPNDTQETFTITELSREFNVTARAIRFYEDKGLIAPTRNGQQRVFSPRDRARLRLILQGKRVGFSLAEIGEMLDLYDLGDRRETQLKHTRSKFEKQVVDLEQQREDIEAALDELKKGIDYIDMRLDQLAKEPESKNGVKVVGYGIGNAAE